MKRLYKSKTNKVIAGVIGGLGEYYEVDPSLLRLAYILIAVLTAVFPAIVGYLVACLVIPSQPSAIHT